MVGATQVATTVALTLSLSIAYGRAYFATTGFAQELSVAFVGATVILAVAYYFVSFLVVEERYTWDLRVLVPWAKRAEIILRLPVLFLLVHGLNYLTERKLPLELLLFGVGVLYFSFIGWDILLLCAPRLTDVNVHKLDERSTHLRAVGRTFLVVDLVLLFSWAAVFIGFWKQPQWKLGGLLMMLGTMGAFGVLLVWGLATADCRDVLRRAVQWKSWR
jgi:hypothetical protein